jgi:ABC-type lipoprotein export system ATPase subunit
MPPEHALIHLENVSKQFESPESAEPLVILREVSLRVEPGESLAIVGPSGSGKSTLLHILGTLERPTQGRVILQGEDLAGLTEVQLAAVRNRRLGFVFQAHYLLPQCTVFENVLVPTLATRTDGKLSSGTSGTESVEERGVRLLNRVGLGSRMSHRPGQLSGGERQRVAVVRALINQPRLVLADEPTGALDHASAEKLGQLLVDLNREEGVATVVVTHALDLARRMSRILELRDGRLATLN